MEKLLKTAEQKNAFKTTNEEVEKNFDTVSIGIGLKKTLIVALPIIHYFGKFIFTPKKWKKVLNILEAEISLYLELTAGNNETVEEAPKGVHVAGSLLNTHITNQLNKV